MHPIAAPLVVMYAVDTEHAYELVQNHHLANDGIDL
jgi:hypothetical protein